MLAHTLFIRLPVMGGGKGAVYRMVKRSHHGGIARPRRYPSWLLRVFAIMVLVILAPVARATVTVTTSTNVTTLANAIAAGNSGITLTGTPTLTGPGTGGAGTATGTFTSTGSSLGIASGIVLSTGNASQIPGTPASTLVNTTFSNTATGNEFDIATFTFSFTPIAGVNRMSIASVFMSEEYIDFVGQGYSDNFSMILTGGAYTNYNVATIPGTTTGTDIDTVNQISNAGYYRDNLATGTALPDIKMDGATTVFINAFDVVPGTTYTLTIRIADVQDAQYDSAVFVATSTILNNPPALDLSNAVAGTGYSTVYDPAGAAVAIAANDDKITDDGTTISSATITITNKQTGDLLTAGSLPSGIVASAYNSATGVLTLSGVATLANYQAAIRGIKFSTTGALTPSPRLISVVVNDGVDNSNTTVASIAIANTALTITKSASAPTVNRGSNTAVTDTNPNNPPQSDQITFTYIVRNTGAVTVNTVVPVDSGPLFNGAGGTGTMGAFTPASATLVAGASQTFTAVYTLSAADISNAAGITGGVTNTARAGGTNALGNPVTSAFANATTSILTVASINLTKTAGAPSTAAGTNTSITDAGDTITFTYVIRNTGSVALTNAFPIDTGPRFNGVNGSTTLSAMSPAAGVALAVGATATFTATYTLSALDVYRAAGITNGVTNSANASARNGTATINAPTASATTTINGVPAVTIQKTPVLSDIAGGGTGTADLNETVTYTFVVRNIGNVTLNDVQVADLHGTPGVLVAAGPGGISSESLTPGPLGSAVSLPDAAANNGIWSILAPGASVTFTYVHTVTQVEIDRG
jgi:uncharacterized repeat protein (TIGR01451 family)